MEWAPFLLVMRWTPFFYCWWGWKIIVCAGKIRSSDNFFTDKFVHCCLIYSHHVQYLGVVLPSYSNSFHLGTCFITSFEGDHLSFCVSKSREVPFLWSRRLQNDLLWACDRCALFLISALHKIPSVRRRSKFLKNLKPVNRTAISKSPLCADIAAKQSVNWGKAKTFPIREIYNLAKDISKYSREDARYRVAKDKTENIFHSDRIISYIKLLCQATDVCS